MSSAIRTEKDPGLRADALGLFESVIMGVAGSGPAYSVAVSTATLIAAVGVLAPASLLYCSLIMFGVVFAFRHLNRLDVNAGASYAWVARVFGPALGFFAGWSVIIGSILFMVSGTLPAAPATLQLFVSSLVGRSSSVFAPADRQDRRCVEPERDTPGISAPTCAIPTTRQSRSPTRSSLTAALFLGFKREEAARFSFLRGALAGLKETPASMRTAGWCSPSASL